MPRIYPQEIKQKAIGFRRKGYSYSEIQNKINYKIPKNTFTGWFKNIVLSEAAKKRIINKIRESGSPGRAIAWEKIKQKRANLLLDIYKKVDNEIKNIDKVTIKICLAMLYLGEGGKTGELFRLGNSDPKVIQLFLKLLREAFEIDEKKLRGHVLCRADQDIKKLEKFWSAKSDIPLNQFYKTKIDKRTIGIPTRKLDYKGVFVIYYLSNAIFLEVKFIGDIICKRMNSGR